MAKRKRPIAPTPLPGEEEKELSFSPQRMVDLEGEEIELRQEAPEIPEGGGTEAPSSDMTRTTMDLTEQANLKQLDEDFREAVKNLPPERQIESIKKRKRAA